MLDEIAQEERGLVLVTGVTGSGKSSTLAAMIDYVNEHRKCHILTIEDPIEFMHRNKKAYVTDDVTLIAGAELGGVALAAATAMETEARKIKTGS